MLDLKILEGIPAFREVPLEIVELVGGLTNHNFKITTPKGIYVVRVSPRGTEMLAIDRETEYRNSIIAADSGVGAPVIAYLPKANTMVVGFLKGTTFTDQSFTLPGVIGRVAASCKMLHSGQRFVNDFDMFVIQRKYLALVQEQGFRLPRSYLDFLPAVDEIRAALSVHLEPTVPCNNDLLAGNFVDDGQKIWLIDYEYSGNNDPCFELGNIWSECHLGDDQLEELVSAYYGNTFRNKIARAKLHGLMSKYGWTLWGSIQEATSTLDFDFWEWSMEKYDAAVEMFRSPNFTRLLEDVQRTD